VDTIAERRLELRSSGQTLEVVVRLARPELDESHEAWKCEYEIRRGETSRSMAIHGGGVLWHLDEPFSSILENGGLLLRPLTQAPK
jgi:hypothetical protein